MSITQKGGNSSYRVHNGLAPKTLPRSLMRTIDFTINKTVIVNLIKDKDADIIEWVQTIYVDNSQSGDPLIITCTQTQQTVTIPAGYQAYLPVLSNEPVFSMTSASGLLIDVHFLTAAYPAAIWSTSSGASSEEYKQVAASQTGSILGTVGAVGDYISGLLIIPATTSPGAVSILDGATSIPLFTGGATSTSNLVSFFIPLGLKSISGGWSVTTGANVSVIAIGSFT